MGCIRLVLLWLDSIILLLLLLSFEVVVVVVVVVSSYGLSSATPLLLRIARMGGFLLCILVTTIDEPNFHSYNITRSLVGVAGDSWDTVLLDALFYGIPYELVATLVVRVVV